MLSIGIVIFREILEIALILTTLLAATRHLQNKNKWVWLGIALGVVGSCIVAFFTETISGMVDGMGQEIFNAAVLILASLMISWTVVWMKRHGRELSQELKDIGQAVSRGDKPLVSLSVVIALSVLREGSEIVLFSYGIIASGAEVWSLFIGGILGVVGGVAVGIGLYLGLVKIATRFMFTFTSWLLIFLASGMLAQATGFLQAAGVISLYSSNVWDTSRILAENSVLGSLLHTLIGYTARPTLMQIIIYILTFGIISTIYIFYNERRPTNMNKVILLFVIVPLVLMAKPADATKKVYSPIIEEGELEFEWRGGYDFDDRDSKDGAHKQKFAVGYGFTDRWFSEIYGEIEKEAQEDEFDFESVEWENRFQLTEQGQYPVDLGLYFAYEITTNDKSADKIEGKILLEKSFDDFVHTANIIFEKAVGNHTDEETEAGIAWSTRYRLKESFEPGFEYHANFGELNENLPYADQTHQAGPVFYGKIGPVKYDVGYLFGITDPAAQGTLKWVMEYELKF